MLTISKDSNPNYLAKIVIIDNIRKHPNADKLQIVCIDGADIIVDMEVKLEDIMIFCPTESCINKEFLSFNSLFSSADLNEDKNKKGYVANSGRVRAIRLRGELSRAFLFPISCIENWLSIKLKVELNQEFDTINDINFICKYVPVSSSRNSISNNSIVKKEDLTTYLADKQFNFHKDTIQLYKGCYDLQPEDYIQITHKFHGTSGIVSNILLNKKVSLFKRVINKLFFINSDFKEYGFVYSSRNSIRGIAGKEKYTPTNIWYHAYKQIYNYISKGMTIYFEIVGYLPDSTVYVQKNYDYGYKQGEFGIYVYRITNTNEDGEVYEFTTQQIKQFCNGKMHVVPELYYGKAKDLFPELEINDEWLKNFKDKLALYSHMEKRDPLCVNKVPFEGLVIRKETFKDLCVYKLKANAFFELETKMLDEDYIGIEE